jgi:hypothetical protein
MAPGAFARRNVMARMALRRADPPVLRTILRSRLFRATLFRPTVSER